GAVGQMLSVFGITGVTDATPDLSERAQRMLAEACARGALPQRVLALGAAVDSTLLPLGPLKLVVDEVAGSAPHAPRPPPPRGARRGWGGGAELRHTCGGGRLDRGYRNCRRNAR